MDIAKHEMMIDPTNQNCKKANEKCYIGWPVCGQELKQRFATGNRRNMNIQNKKRDCKTKNTATECLQPGSHFICFHYEL